MTISQTPDQEYFDSCTGIDRGVLRDLGKLLMARRTEAIEAAGEGPHDYSLEQQGELTEEGPMTPGVYCLMTRRCEPIYIGMTNNFRQRLRCHSSDLSKIAAGFDWWIFYPIADPVARRAVELHLIATSHPRLNVADRS